MAKHRDLTGMVFSRLTVVGKYSTGPVKWECKCSCGNPVNVIVGTSSLTCKNTESCGCIKREMLAQRNFKHGMSKLPEYFVWKDMKKRCNSADERYKTYKEKGIAVAEEWLEDFTAFYRHIGPRPKQTSETVWTVGRIDNTKGYEPGNVRWETLSEQARNHSLQRNNKSGVSGIQVDDRDVVATFSLPSGPKTKSFSVRKYGLDRAKELAIAWRQQMLVYAEAAYGYVYAESHGVPVHV